VRLILAALLMWPLLAGAVARDLDDCDTIVTPPTALAPLDLDTCDIDGGDNITGILTGLDDAYGAVHVRAPAATLTVEADYVDWGTRGVTNFTFLEAESSLHRFTVQFTAVGSVRTMWAFTSVGTVTIGGPNLGLTFSGTHPGLGLGTTVEGTGQEGLIYFNPPGSHTGGLVEVRANFYKTKKNGIFFTGAQNAASATGDIAQVNIAGVFVGSGFNINGGVHAAWIDPDRTVIMDPWARGLGWDGAAAGTSGDISYGCSDTDRYEYRHFPQAVVYFTYALTGGVTLEYGGSMANMFGNRQIGNGATDPYIIRVKDWGFTGPNNITGYPSGVLTKMIAQTHGVIKHDPLPDYGDGIRHIRMIQLPYDYGNGHWSSAIASGCAEGNDTNNNQGTGGSAYVWRAEATNDGVQSSWVTAYVNITFQGFTQWQSMSAATYVQGSSPSLFPCGAGCFDRSFGHTLRVASGTAMPGWANGTDTTTVTGPGTWNNITFTRVPLNGGGYVNPNDNTVTDTRVAGIVQVGQDATGTVINNVEFTGTARAVITIGTSSDVTVTDLCVPNGSTITGTGTLTYEGAAQTLPYTIPDGTANCSISTDPLPGVVTGGSVG
jgi:hypothetical protein